LVAAIGCHWSYSTSVFLRRSALVEYDQWHPEGRPNRNVISGLFLSRIPFASGRVRERDA
jgi:hypothetical protein